MSYMRDCMFYFLLDDRPIKVIKAYADRWLMRVNNARVTAYAWLEKSDIALIQRLGEARCKADIMRQVMHDERLEEIVQTKTQEELDYITMYRVRVEAKEDQDE